MVPFKCKNMEEATNSSSGQRTREQTKRGQLSFKVLLSRRFSEVRHEWHAFKGESAGKYSPAVDLAVGPFAEGDLRLKDGYDELFLQHRGRLQRLIGAYPRDDLTLNRDIDSINGANPNSRCFLAIELVHSGSRKHRIGDIVNACSLGRVGIIIAWDASIQKSFFGIARYLNFLMEKKK